MKLITSVIDNQSGSVLVVALMILVLLTVIGITASTTTNIEIQVANNEKLYKTAFYAADGGAEAAHELLEQNIACPDGFSGYTVGNMGINDGCLGFWKNELDDSQVPSDNQRDAFFPDDYTGSQPHTNLTFNGVTGLEEGASILMAVGYEGKGKGMAGHGAYIIYDIYSQHKGRGNSESTIMIGWKHMIGQEGECKY